MSICLMYCLLSSLSTSSTIFNCCFVTTLLSTMSASESSKSRALTEGEKTNREGNKLFKKKKYLAAIKKYDSVARAMFAHKPSGFDPDRALTDHENLMVKALSNQAQCYINLGEYFEAQNTATQAALFSNRTHVKSIYRAALAFSKLGNNPSALDFLDEVLQLSPDNAAAIKLKQSIQKTLHDNPPEVVPFVAERIKVKFISIYFC